MFEAVELGRKIAKNKFKEQEPHIRAELLEIQQALRELKIPVVIIVSGVETAGKGEVVNRLNKWLDTRGLQTHAFWDETDEEKDRPDFWRFWRRHPPRGSIAIMFGSWYTDPIVNHAYKVTSDSDLDDEMNRIRNYEQMLINDGALIIKLWFHLSRDEQKKRLKIKAKTEKNLEVVKTEKKYAKHYDDFITSSERAIRLTDTGDSPWYLVEAEDKWYRDMSMAQILINHLKPRLHEKRSSERRSIIHEPVIPIEDTANITILDHIDVAATLDDKSYRKELAQYQKQLHRLSWEAYQKKRSCVALFEGWDAAGKGGAIRRITAAVDARLYRVISIAAPTDEELAHHYLWRFWRHIPRAGYMTLYDRSWYGRVLVERVEGFAEQYEWMRAYQEITEFEEQLTDHGIILTKFWLHISNDEQLRRFKEREEIPWKQHKITDEDWRNREQWDNYKMAVNNMVEHTSTSYAPWYLISGNDKNHSRIQILKTLCEQLERALD